MREACTVALAEVEKFRVGGQPEGLFMQTIKRCIHARISCHRDHGPVPSPCSDISPEERIGPARPCQVVNSIPAIHTNKGVIEQVRHWPSHPATRVPAAWTEKPVLSRSLFMA